jgi:GNAT superfamily N-acetyltransferase
MSAKGNFKLRPAKQSDGSEIAAVFSPSLRLLTFLPPLHSVEDNKWFIDNVILAECEVTVATSNGSVVAFLALQGEEIRLLHTHPDFVGRGAGSLLVRHAQSNRASTLELWCFQANAGARRFYERHGFHPVLFTDGIRNEEKIPDVQYRWKREGVS